MKTILQINSVVNSGSTGRIAEEIGITAKKNEWESYIAYGRGTKNNSKSKLIKIGLQKDIILHGIKTRLFDKHGLASEKVTKKLIEQILIIKPSIIHLHNIHGYFLNYPILFKYLSSKDIPIVWTFHDCWPITGHCSHFDYIGCEKWKTGCSHCPQKNTYPASLLFDNSKKNFSLKKNYFSSIKRMVLVPVSYWLSDILKQSFLNKYPINVIHNGINTSQFKPLPADDIKLKNAVNKKFIILGVANVWSPRKGLKDFIKLSKLLNKDSIIILIGLSNKQIQQLPKEIIGIQRTKNIEELVKYYSIADVFVNPTWEDNFPTTNLEALACGTPVITYNTGGSPEAINKETGFVIEKGDINGIINAIQTIKNYGKKTYQKVCIERATKNFNKDDRFKEYIDLYNKLLINQ